MDVDLHGPSVAGMLGFMDKHVQVEGEKLIPFRYSDHLEFLSAQGFLAQQDDALIWRGPLKVGAIRQFMSDTKWDPLDYLIIDCPPGTGDEPLTVVQTIKDAEAIIVTTPQKVALADVRKSLSFCQLGHIPVRGIIENMSGFVCPHCGQEVDIFKAGGGKALAEEKGLPFLGAGSPSIPRWWPPKTKAIPWKTSVKPAGRRWMPLWIKWWNRISKKKGAVACATAPSISNDSVTYVIKVR